ncbi:PPOX class F420-dependent oxidoreductase [Terrabacter tumescens]|uniref:PPOX class F420-dependent oxidoreductase n=1 Tax=Terrabacter tumescens TaxID=60443 RepID=A0ABQ2I5M3_9MICO|nr:TIGR03668 family PPOX class F420-dependent oxidoreductase [Terrabacter tumescens]GGN01242.1 PPOX class F420-dependent oxidoreductase [Terrabacter tumescens]
MDEDARARFAAARVARLATVRPGGRPHLVPIVFVVSGDVVWSAVDDKPKSTRALQRLANIEANPSVALLVDHYDDDWTQLWWVRAEGRAEVVELGAAGTAAALDSLAQKYPQYAAHRPAGPFVRVNVTRWSGWSHGHSS